MYIIIMSEFMLIIILSYRFLEEGIFDSEKFAYVPFGAGEFKTQYFNQDP